MALITDLLKRITTHPLNRDRKLQALARFTRWQVGSRLVGGKIVYDWVNGSKFLACAGETGVTGNIYYGLHEFRDMTYLLHVLRREDLFVDVGANVGSYSILASSAIGARSYTFEPVPQTYARLIANMRLNYLDDRVKCFNMGVGQRQGNLAFTSGVDTMNHVLADGKLHHDSVLVEVTTLDEMLADETPALIKIDVEGYETPVLAGAEAVLQNDALHSVIMELNGEGRRYGFADADIVQLMADYGFGTYAYDPFHRELLDLNGALPTEGNMLFVRNKAFVHERLRTAPTINIHGTTL